MTHRQQRARNLRRRAPRALAAGGGLAAAATLLSGSLSEAAATPATVTVTTLGDTATPSANHVHHHRAPTLADAIAYVDSTSTGGTITFASKLSGTINVTSRLPYISKPTYLDGPGPGRLTIHDEVSKSADIAIRVPNGRFAVITGVTLSGGSLGGILTYSPVIVSDATITHNTNVYGGGGILGINPGYLEVIDSTIAGNHAPQAGAIATIGQGGVLIEGSTISGNRATKNIGGLGFLAASKSPGPTVDIENSTIADNVAGGDTGGVYLQNQDPSRPTDMTILGSTISGNVANGGPAGGILDHYGHIELDDTILAGNHDTATGNQASPDLKIDGTGAKHQVRARFSLIGDGAQTGAGSPITNRTDRVGTARRRINPHLSPLAHHRGPTKTMLPRTGSPAIRHGNAELFFNAIPGFPFELDQRGRARVGLGGGAKRSDRTDIGAVEVTRIAQFRRFGKGNQQFMLSTAAKNRRLNPHHALPVRYTSTTLTLGRPKLTFKRITLRISGSKRTFHSHRPSHLAKLRLRGLARGRHTLTARITYRYTSGGHSRRLTKTLRLNIHIR